MNLTTEGNLIEEYICNDKQIPYLSKKYGFHEHYVRNLVSKYFGTGKFKVTSSHKGTRRKSSIIKYSNLTNLKEVYEQERNRSR